jgi:hypothetical protein
MIQQPALPASTVAATNTSGGTAYVTVTGGTVTHIAVNGSDVATATNYTATVPAGATIAVTYSSAPAWYWSAITPAVPASTVAAVNTTGQDVTVILAAGTTTHIAVNGTDRGTTTPAQVMVPPGGSIAVTYSAAPVWAWITYPDMAGLDSLGVVYAQPNTNTAYSPLAQLPYPVHAEGGLAGLAAGVSN